MKISEKCGLRSPKLTKEGFYINGKKVFRRLILDQGSYPDGVYTAPSDEEPEADIRRSMAMGIPAKYPEAEFCRHGLEFRKK